MKKEAVAKLARTLHVDLDRWTGQERTSFSNFAFVASMLPELADWNSADKSALIDIIRSKAAPEERQYLQLQQQHDTLKRAVVNLGSSTQ
jgi:hypothetical protein